MSDLSYPIGHFDRNYTTTLEARQERIETIKNLPRAVGDAIAGLSEEQLDSPYRPEGWTVRQTVHHIADSHANSLIRFKLALTEDEPPMIKPYYEDRWAELGDSKISADVSLKMIDAIHSRWSSLLESMSDEDFQKTFIHPETGVWPLQGALALYAWHSLHHTAHITHLRERMNW